MSPSSPKFSQTLGKSRVPDSRTYGAVHLWHTARHCWLRTNGMLTIVVSQQEIGSLVCIVGDKDYCAQVSSSLIPDTLSLLVKWFSINNAGGGLGPLVLVFAVPSIHTITSDLRRMSTDDRLTNRK